MKEPARRTFEVLNEAIGLAIVESAGEILFIIGEVIADKKVELTIVVIIKKGCTSTPQVVVHPRVARHIPERAFTSVVIELAGAITSDVKIRPAVIIIVTDSQ